MAAVFGVENSKEGDDNSVKTDRNSDLYFKSEQNTKTRALVPDSKQTGLIEECEKVDLDHVPDSHCRKLRDMYREVTPMWDEALGTVRKTEHRIDLSPNTPPNAQNSYRAGPEAREEEKFATRWSHWTQVIALVPTSRSCFILGCIVEILYQLLTS